MKKKYIVITRLTQCFHCVIPFFFILFFLSCCQDKEITETAVKNPRLVSVVLDLNTRNLTEHEETGFLGDIIGRFQGPDTWYLNGHLAPDPTNPDVLPRIAIKAYNKTLGKVVYSKLIPFSASVFGDYRAIINIPEGETEFYAMYAPNQIGADIPYYEANGIMTNKFPWNFSGTLSEDINFDKFIGTAIPVILNVKDKNVSLPKTNPYNGENPTPDVEQTIEWEILDHIPSMVSWEKEKGIANKLHQALLSGKTNTRVVLTSEKQEKIVKIPLFRDFSRVRVFLAVGQPGIAYSRQSLIKTAFLNMPVMQSPSFRTTDDKIQDLAGSTPEGEKVERYTGAYSYGYLFGERDGMGEYTNRGVMIPPINVSPDENFYDAMEKDLFVYEQFFVPQYMAPYIPEVNSWQKEQPHPKLLLEVMTVPEGGSEYDPNNKRRIYVIDIGEQGKNPGVYDGPIYPNRDYRVFVVLPEDASEHELIYRVDSWKSKNVDFPDFQ